MKERLKLTGQLKRFLQWPLILSVILLAMNFVVYGIDTRAGIFVSVVVAIYVMISISLMVYYRPAIFRELIGFAHEYDDVQKTMLSGLKLPYALLDGDGNVIWMNKAFAGIIGKTLTFRKNLGLVFENLTPETLPRGDEQVEVPLFFNNSYYNLTMHRIAIDRMMESVEILESVDKYDYLIATYLFDVTELNQYKK